MVATAVLHTRAVLASWAADDAVPPLSSCAATNPSSAPHRRSVTAPGGLRRKPTRPGPAGNIAEAPHTTRWCVVEVSAALHACTGRSRGQFAVGKKPTMQEQARTHTRELKQTDRELVRDRHKLDAEEQRLTNEIRKTAATGNKKAVEILAKQLVKVRNQKAQSLQASGQIQGLATQTTMMVSNAKIANAMGTTAKTMEKMNKVMNPEQMAKVSQQFTQEHMKLGITDDMIGETLEAALGQDGDSEEEDAIVNQVLDEIGIEVNTKIANAPRVPNAAAAMTNRRQTNEEDAELERILAGMK